MDLIDFYNLMNKYGKEIAIEFTEEQLNKFYKYMNMLIEWNKKINLTAIVEPKEIILKHFIDSLAILKYTENIKTFIDIGSGAGFPGIPVKIMNEKLEVTLLDSLNKRINFLNEVIKELKLKNIKTIHSRIEDYGRNKLNRESYDIVTARAVANLSTLSEYMLPLTKVGGESICMKGPDIEQEIDKGNKAIELLGGKIKNIEKLELPKSRDKRTIIQISKIKKTPLKYPRKAGTPAKEPIK